MPDLTELLLSMGDPSVADFTAKLVPNIARERFLGIKLPVLKQLAKERYGTPEADAFLAALPHTYIEEDHLHAFLLMRIKDYQECVNGAETLLPYLDCWATCDTLRPPAFRKNLPDLHERTGKWLRSDHPYTVRFGIAMRMCHFLNEQFDPNDLREIAAIRSDAYYIRMMVAWYFATALAKQYDAAVQYLENRLLDDWTHRKTIQKATESYRVSPEHKEYLRTLRGL